MDDGFRAALEVAAAHFIPEQQFSEGGGQKPKPISPAAHKKLEVYDWKHDGNSEYSHAEYPTHKIKIVGHIPVGGGRTSVSWEHHEEGEEPHKSDGVEQLGYRLGQIVKRESQKKRPAEAEFARRIKPAAGQGSFSWDEDSHPRESDAHDGKRPGEFAPKDAGNATASTKEVDNPPRSIRDVKVYGGVDYDDLDREVSESYEKYNKSLPKEDLSLFNPKVPTYGKVWAEAGSRRNLPGHYVIAGISGNMSGVPVAMLDSEDAARSFAKDFESGRTMAIDNHQRWGEYIKAAHAAKPIDADHLSHLRSLGRMSGIHEGREIGPDDVRAMYNAGHSFAEKDLPMSTMNPSREITDKYPSLKEQSGPEVTNQAEAGDGDDGKSKTRRSKVEKPSAPEMLKWSGHAKSLIDAFHPNQVTFGEAGDSFKRDFSDLDIDQRKHVLKHLKKTGVINYIPKDLTGNAVLDRIREQVKLQKNEHLYSGRSAGRNPDPFTSSEWYKSLSNAADPQEFARRIKPASNQSSFNWDEDAHPREEKAHDNKRPGEFAPKESASHPEPAASVVKAYPSLAQPSHGEIVRSGELEQKQQLRPNHVYGQVRNRDGNVLGYVSAPHDGTEEGMRDTHSKLKDSLFASGHDWSNIQTKWGATDHTATHSHTISPNGQNIVEAGTPEARYVLGDLSAKLAMGPTPEELEEGKRQLRKKLESNLAQKKPVSLRSVEKFPDLHEQAKADGLVIDNNNEGPMPTDYWYGLRNRPPGPGAVPKGGFQHKPHPDYRHGQISYGRPLTHEEEANYELERIFDKNDLASVAKDVADKFLGKHLNEYVKPENDASLTRRLNQPDIRRSIGHFDIDDLKSHLRSQFAGNSQGGQPDITEKYPSLKDQGSPADRIESEASSIADGIQAMKNRSMVYQADEKERLAEKHGKPHDAYYDLPFSEWEKIRDTKEDSQPSQGSAQKRPWEMTRAEYASRVTAEKTPGGGTKITFPIGGGKTSYMIVSAGSSLSGSPIEKILREYDYHGDAVKKAIRDGEPVPPEVLAEHPDIASRYSTRPSPGDITQKYPSLKDQVTPADESARHDRIGDRVSRFRAAVDSASKSGGSDSNEVLKRHSVTAGLSQDELIELGKRLGIDAATARDTQEHLSDAIERAISSHGQSAMDRAEGRNLPHKPADALALDNQIKSVAGQLVDLDGKPKTAQWNAKREKLQSQLDHLKEQRSNESPADSTQKQPWEMTREEYARQMASIPASGGFAARANYKTAKPYHRFLVEKAVSEGHPVPSHVLADYPELADKLLEQFPSLKEPPQPVSDRPKSFAEIGPAHTAPIVEALKSGDKAKAGQLMDALLKQTKAKSFEGHMLAQKLMKEASSGEVDGESAGETSSPSAATPEPKQYDIYETRINHPDGPRNMFAVAMRPDGKRGTGDTLHGTREEAEQQIERAKSSAQFAEEAKSRIAQKEAEDAKRKAEKADLGGYEATLSGPSRGKAIEHLDKLARLDGKDARLRDHVQRLVESGELTSVREEPKVKPMTRTQFNRADNREQAAHEKRMKEGGNIKKYLLGGWNVGKIAYDYANHLIEKKNASQIAEKYPSLNAADEGFPFDLEAARAGMEKRGYAEYGDHKVKVVPHPNGGVGDKSTFAVEHYHSDGKTGANRTMLPEEYPTIEAAQDAAINHLSDKVKESVNTYKPRGRGAFEKARLSVKDAIDQGIITKGDDGRWYGSSGQGSGRPYGSAGDAIDAYFDNQQKLQRESDDQRLAQHKDSKVKAVRDGDSVTVSYPDGKSETMTMRQYRQRVFDIEDKYGSEVSLIDKSQLPTESGNSFSERYQKHIDSGKNDHNAMIHSLGEYLQERGAKVTKDEINSNWHNHHIGSLGKNSTDEQIKAALEASVDPNARHHSEWWMEQRPTGGPYGQSVKSQDEAMNKRRSELEEHADWLDKQADVLAAVGSDKAPKLKERASQVRNKIAGNKAMFAQLLDQEQKDKVAAEEAAAEARRWKSDPTPARALTEKGLAKKVGPRYVGLNNMLHETGWYSDGKILMDPPEKLLSKLKELMPPEEGARFPDVKPYIEQAESRSGPPMKVVGTRTDKGDKKDPDTHSVLMADAKDRHHVLDAVYVQTILKHYPHATFHSTTDEDGERSGMVAVKNGGKTVAVLMEQSLEHPVSQKEAQDHVDAARASGKHQFSRSVQLSLLPGESPRDRLIGAIHDSLDYDGQADTAEPIDSLIPEDPRAIDGNTLETLREFSRISPAVAETLAEYRGEPTDERADQILASMRGR